MPSIAVLSDTHDALPPAVLDQLRGADEIWHLGDVCSPSVLDLLASLGTPLSVVRGNCDPGYLWPEQLKLERHGFIFILQHQPPRAIRQKAHAVLHGHLHQPVREELMGVAIRSPGAVTSPRNGFPSSFAWLRLAPETKSWSWEIEPVLR